MWQKSLGAGVDYAEFLLHSIISLKYRHLQTVLGLLDLIWNFECFYIENGHIEICIRQPSRNTYLVVHILPLKLMDTYHTTHAHREFKTSNKLLQLRFRSDLPIADWKSTLNFLFLSTSRMVKMPLPKTAHCVSLIRLISCTSTKPWVFFLHSLPPWLENIEKCQYWMQ